MEKSYGVQRLFTIALPDGRVGEELGPVPREASSPVLPWPSAPSTQSEAWRVVSVPSPPPSSNCYLV